MRNNNLNNNNEDQLLNDLYDLDNYTDDLVEFVKTGIIKTAKTIINIGLEASTTLKTRIDTIQKRKIITINLFKAIDPDCKIIESIQPGESTLIIETSKDINKDRFYNISKLLDQDCIAVFKDNKGELYGPLAKLWGSFNIDYFKFN